MFLIPSSRNLTAIVSIVAALLFSTSLFADNSYHAWLRDHLRSEFGVTGGTWVFAESEIANIDAINTSGGATSRVVNVSGQPFTKAVRVTSPSALRFPWDRAIFLNSNAPVSKGDTMLLVFWVRSNRAEAANGIFRAEFRKGAAPWEASLRKKIAPGTKWQQWFIPFEMSDSLTAGNSTIVFQIGSQTQTLEFGGVAILNFGNALSVADLEPVRTRIDEDYSGRRANATWRATANARIAELRMVDLKVKVLDRGGRPVVGATVDIEMQKHEYGFGSAIASSLVVDSSRAGVTYRNKILDLDGRGHGFNIGTTEGDLQWIAWKNSNKNVLANLAWLKKNEIDIRGHSIIWPRNDWPVPNDVRARIADTAFVDSRVRQHIIDELTHPAVNGNLIAWDFVNELAHERFFSESFAKMPQYPSGDEVFAHWLQVAHRREPAVKMFYNEYEILSDGALNIGFHNAHRDLIQLLQTESGGKLAGIGMQSHINLPLAGPARVISLLDEYSTAFPDLEIQITEYDLDIGNDVLAADYLRDFMTAVFSHPQTSAFVMWGFWDGQHWLNNAPLFNEDWTPKPAYDQYVGLVFDKWWTEESGHTDGDGSYATRGFKGEYTISASYGSLKTTVNVRIKAGQNSQTIILSPMNRLGPLPKTKN